MTLSITRRPSSLLNHSGGLPTSLETVSPAAARQLHSSNVIVTRKNNGQRARRGNRRTIITHDGTPAARAAQNVFAALLADFAAPNSLLLLLAYPVPNGPIILSFPQEIP